MSSLCQVVNGEHHNSSQIENAALEGRQLTY